MAQQNLYRVMRSSTKRRAGARTPFPCNKGATQNQGVKLYAKVHTVERKIDSVPELWNRTRRTGIAMVEEAIQYALKERNMLINGIKC